MVVVWKEGPDPDLACAPASSNDLPSDHHLFLVLTANHCAPSSPLQGRSIGFADVGTILVDWRIRCGDRRSSEFTHRYRTSTRLVILHPLGYRSLNVRMDCHFLLCVVIPNAC